MSDRIRDHIAARIFDGTLQPGDRLVELEIAREFDTSQTPVREALRELESSRLVESVPYRGTRVRGISDEEMVEAYTVRGALEQLAGELAAPRLRNQVGDLRQLLKALHAAARSRDLEGYSQHNHSFHRRIVEASGNKLLIQAWEALNFETRVRITLVRKSEALLVSRAAEHDPIVDALEAGDGVTAGKLLRQHSNACCERWRETPSEGDQVQGTLERDQEDRQAPASCLS